MKFLKNIVLVTLILLTLAVNLNLTTAYCLDENIEQGIEQEYSVSDLMILNYLREHRIESIVLHQHSEASILQITKPIRDYTDDVMGAAMRPYQMFSYGIYVGDLIVFNIDGITDVTILCSGYSQDAEVQDMSKYEILCEYDLINHCIVGEENIEPQTILFDSNTVVYNGIEPLVQVDNNGIGRDWCFLSSMAMIINHYENENYSTGDLANIYLNTYEVNHSELNESGYISNREVYTGSTVQNINYTMQYRGYVPTSTTSINYNKAKKLVDNDNTALLIFTRYPRLVINAGTEDAEIIEPNTPDSLFDTVLGRHAVVLYGYDPSDGSVVVADPSPVEPVPGPYTPTISKIIKKSSNKSYLFVRDTNKIDSTEYPNLYKVYILTTTLEYGRGNIYSNYVNQLDDIVGQKNKQLSAFACMASIFNKFEGTYLTTEEVARGYIPYSVLEYIDESEYDIFSIPLGTSLDVPYFTYVLGLRGYQVSGNLGYRAYTLKNVQDTFDLGWGMGLVFDVLDESGNEVMKHFTLVKSVDIPNNKITIMDPSGVGSYRVFTKDTTTSLDGSYYGNGYTLVPNGFFRYKL